MPGAYTHLSVVAVAGSPQKISRLGGLDNKTIGPILTYAKYTELGAVSPDYPYLHIGNEDSKAWADAMHYMHTGDRLKQGASYIRTLQGEVQYKALAWLLGFASHVVTDVTIHPVVELKTGPYEVNPKGHRVCEMNQDVFIYEHLNMGEILGDAFIHSGLSACSAPEDPNKLDPLIVDVWSNMLKQVDKNHYAESPPAFNKWHSGFHRMLGMAGNGRLIPLARHVIADQGLVYPEEPDETYIRQLRIPSGGHMDYSEIFNKACDNVQRCWGQLVQYCLKDSPNELSYITNWNLDTGRDENGHITMWE